VGLCRLCPFVPLLQSYGKLYVQVLCSRHVDNMVFKGSVVGIYKLFLDHYRYRFSGQLIHT